MVYGLAILTVMIAFIGRGVRVGPSAKMYSLARKSSIAGILIGTSRRLPEETVQNKKPQTSFEIRLQAE